MHSSMTMVETFRYPQPVENCDCIICTRKGVNEEYVDPPPLFQTYK